MAPMIYQPRFSRKFGGFEFHAKHLFEVAFICYMPIIRLDVDVKVVMPSDLLPC